MIEFRSLEKRFGRNHALRGISMTVRDHEIMGLAGMNGAGKTTMIRVAAGLTIPDSGDVMVDGHSILHERRMALRSTAWVPEVSNMDPMDSPWILFNEFGSMFGYSRDHIRSKSDECMKQVSLNNVMRKSFSSFSNGMKKRFLIALSLFQNARNYLFDETFASIDPVGSALLKEIILNLRDQGFSILLSSHILSELQDISDRVSIINSGKLTGTFNPEEMSGSVMTLRSRSNPAIVTGILSRYGSVAKDGHVYTVRGDNITGIREQIMKSVGESGIEVISISFGTERLQDIFLRSMESDE